MKRIISVLCIYAIMLLTMVGCTPKAYRERIKVFNEIGAEYGVSDFRWVKYDQGQAILSSKSFGELDYEEMLQLFGALKDTTSWDVDCDNICDEGIRILAPSAGHSYIATVSDDRSLWTLHEDSLSSYGLSVWTAEDVYSMANPDYQPSQSGSVGSSSRTSSSTTCPTCGGLGSVKYYYGGSAVEAALNGHDDYEWGVCPMCNGTGKVSD